jgi:hypothetical protein
LNPNVSVQKADTLNLNFIEARMNGGGFNMHLWYAFVEDYYFMAKYFYDTIKAGKPEIVMELEKAVLAISTLQLFSPKKV